MVLKKLWKYNFQIPQIPPINRWHFLLYNPFKVNFYLHWNRKNLFKINDISFFYLSCHIRVPLVQGEIFYNISTTFLWLIQSLLPNFADENFKKRKAKLLYREKVVFIFSRRCFYKIYLVERGRSKKFYKEKL